MAPKCGVCHQEISKYKCPVCELRYCSLTCYKSHKPTHEDEIGSAKAEGVQQPKRGRPGTTQRVPKIDFTGFENDKDFKNLLPRYPLLKVQLQAIYGLTLEPGPNEARTWNRQPLPGLSPPNLPSRGGRGRGRGRNDLGHGGSRGGRYGTATVGDEREYGPWTQTKGDKEALSVIKKMRGEGSELDDVSEGMKEFVELCRIKFGGEAGGSRHGE